MQIDFAKGGWSNGYVLRDNYAYKTLILNLRHHLNTETVNQGGLSINKFSHELFGRSFGEITMDYIDGIGRFIAPVFHIIALVIIILVIVKGNAIIKYFTIYFIINYLWLFIFVGLYMSFLLFKKMGIAFIKYLGPVQFLLLFILLQWIKELKSQKTTWTLRIFPCIGRWLYLLSCLVSGTLHIYGALVSLSR